MHTGPLDVATREHAGHIEEEVKLADDVACIEAGNEKDVRHPLHIHAAVINRTASATKKYFRKRSRINNLTIPEVPRESGFPEQLEIPVRVKRTSDLPLAGKDGDPRFRVSQKTIDKKGVLENLGLRLANPA